MVNWIILEQEYASLAIVSEVAGGIYLWEWAITVYFDWRMFSSFGKGEWRWTTILYLISRYTTLDAIICIFVFLNLKNEFNCEALIRICAAFGTFALFSSYVLNSIRMYVDEIKFYNISSERSSSIAIWKRKLLIVVLVSLTILANAGILIWVTIDHMGAVWSPLLGGCLITKTSTDKVQINFAFACEFLLAVLMLIDIWLQKGSGRLWQLIYHQGLTWLLIALTFYVPVVVLTWLNLSDAMNMMLQVPLCIAMSICATRMHRGLYEYAHPDEVI
ncbi:hypothetical protein A0H81_12324 [Grifola frondosa]|uniref:Uncharacterized protein n=1 Tax=Grifola frondosa TaxID=5627 RepID=A0A1C7LT60_GRIFR|nr:hypothetical protein A0H81_12324 [Grifola frondosa]